MFVFVRIARVFFLIAFCCSTAFADMHPGQSYAAVEPNGDNASDAQSVPENKSGDLAVPPVALLAPDMLTHSKDTLPSAEPFDLPATIAPTGEMAAKWSELQSRILADEKALAACRSDESTCSQAASRFLSIVELGRKHDGRARLGWINRAVNMSIRPASDWDQYGYADFWASPLQTLASGAGDCEDYAIVKYVALRALGIGGDDLRFVVVEDEMRQTGHAVVAVRYEQQWLVLDNRTMAILNAEDMHHYHPLFASDQHGTRTVASAAVDRVTDR